MVGGVLLLTGDRQAAHVDCRMGKLVIERGPGGVEGRRDRIGIASRFEGTQTLVGILVADRDLVLSTIPERVRFPALRPHQRDVVRQFERAVDLLGNVLEKVRPHHHCATGDCLPARSFLVRHIQPRFGGTRAAPRSHQYRHCDETGRGVPPHLLADSVARFFGRCCGHLDRGLERFLRLGLRFLLNRPLGIDLVFSLLGRRRGLLCATADRQPHADQSQTGHGQTDRTSET